MSRTSTVSSSRPNRPRALDPQVPTTAASVGETLAALGVRPSRALGQSFLLDPFVADALASLALPAEGRPLIEVGGGLGLVTSALLRRGVSSLQVIERDPRLASHLERTFRGRVTVKRADVLEVEIPRNAVVVGSLPYSVATPLLLRLMTARTEKVAALVQKEVAERFGARAGNRAYGRPTILAACVGEVELFQDVSASSFSPRPKVAGRLLTFRARTGELPVPSLPRLESIVRTLFSSRRKQLGNLLPRLQPRRSDPSDLAHRAGWPSGWERLRPESLPPEAYFSLARQLESG